MTLQHSQLLHSLDSFSNLSLDSFSSLSLDSFNSLSLYSSIHNRTVCSLDSIVGFLVQTTFQD